MFTVSALSQFMPVTHFYGSHAIKVEFSDRGRQRFIVSDRDGAKHFFDFLHDAEAFCDALDRPRAYTVATIAVNDWDTFVLVYDPEDPDHYRQDDSFCSADLEEITLEEIVKMPLVDADLSVDSMQWLTEEVGSSYTVPDDDGEEVAIDILDRAVLVR